MDEQSLSGWNALSGSSPYTADNSGASQNQYMSNLTAGASMQGAPPMSGMMGGNYGGSVSPSSTNGYPMFSSPQAGLSSPAGYVSANPVNATPSVIQSQARSDMPQAQPMNPSMPTQATMNPWNVKSSSSPGAFDYPMGQSVPPPKLNVL